jgi:hypothetical protein
MYNISTACNNIPYDLCVLNKTMFEWAKLVFENYSLSHKVKYKPLEVGTYTSDSIIIQLFNVFNYIINVGFENINTYDAAYCAKLGWEANYTFWRDNQPFYQSNIYKKPSIPIYSEYREQRLNSMDIRATDKIILNTILDVFGPVESYGVIQILNDYCNTNNMII